MTKYKVIDENDVEVDFSRFMKKINEIETKKKTRSSPTFDSEMQNGTNARVCIERYTERAVNRIKIGKKE